MLDKMIRTITPEITPTRSLIALESLLCGTGIFVILSRIHVSQLWWSKTKFLRFGGEIIMLLTFTCPNRLFQSLSFWRFTQLKFHWGCSSAKNVRKKISLLYLLECFFFLYLLSLKKMLVLAQQKHWRPASEVDLFHITPTVGLCCDLLTLVRFLIAIAAWKIITLCSASPLPPIRVSIQGAKPKTTLLKTHFQKKSGELIS